MKKYSIWLLAALAALANPAIAAEPGDWIIRAGPYGITPKSNNSDIVSVEDGFGLGFNFTYHWTENLAVEVLAAAPFSHDIELLDGTKVAETKHLPPTVSLQYHFDTDSAFRPYVGAGLNYTLFFDEKTLGPISGTSLSLEESFGLAAQLGADFDLSDRLVLNVDLRYIDIETDASLDGVALTKADISPFVFGVTLGWRL